MPQDWVRQKVEERKYESGGVISICKAFFGLITRTPFLLTRGSMAARAHRTLTTSTDFDTKSALNDIYGAIEGPRMCTPTLHELIYHLNAKLAQVEPMFDCAHAVFTLLTKSSR